MKINERWREIVLDAHSMRAAMAVAVIALFPDIAYLALGFDIVSPYVRGWFTLVAVALIFVGRVAQQGIEDGSRTLPTRIALRRTLHLVGGAMLLCAAMVLLSVGGWLWALLQTAIG